MGLSKKSMHTKIELNLWMVQLKLEHYVGTLLLNLFEVVKFYALFCYAAHSSFRELLLL